MASLVQASTTLSNQMGLLEANKSPNPWATITIVMYACGRSQLYKLGVGAQAIYSPESLTLGE